MIKILSSNFIFFDLLFKFAVIMIDFNIHNEMGSLKKVVVGSAYDFGGVPELDE